MFRPFHIISLPEACDARGDHESDLSSVWYGSLLATGGGLVFGGDVDRWFNAFDATTGDVLWRTRLAASAQGYPRDL